MRLPGWILLGALCLTAGGCSETRLARSGETPAPFGPELAAAEARRVPRPTLSSLASTPN